MILDFRIKETASNWCVMIDAMNVDNCVTFDTETKEATLKDISGNTSKVILKDAKEYSTNFIRADKLPITRP